MPITDMIEAVLAQIQCEQPACNIIGIAVIAAYTGAITAAIVAVIYFLHKRSSDRRLR